MMEEALTELQAYTDAYLQIFQAVLKKLPGETPPKQQKFIRLKEFLRDGVTHPDQFLSQMPEFARILGVKEAALSNYVGANFLNVLTRVKAQKAGNGNSQGEQPNRRPDPNDDSDILLQILNLGSFIIAPDHFESLGMGELKLVTAQGDVLARAESGPGQEQASAPVESAPEPVATSAPAETAADSSVPRKPEKEIEKSILTEILETFGSQLDIPQKLDVDPFAGLNGDTTAAEAPVQVSAAIPKADPATAAVTATNTANTAHLKTGPGVDLGPDEPIIAEILKKFGSQLDIPEKLEPVDFPADNSGALLESQVAVAEPPPQVAPPAEEVAENPIQLSFKEYMNLVRQIQEFQKSGNSEAYRGWLNGDAGRAGKAFVGLRNIQQKAGSGASVDWPVEYENLSRHLDASTPEVSAFHRRVRGFAHLQKLIGNLRGRLGQLQPPVQAALRKIWPQVLILLDQAQDTQGYMSQLQISMLQISDAGVKEQLNLFLRPYFKQVENVYQQIS